jgi:hypothetical protein
MGPRYLARGGNTANWITSIPNPGHSTEKMIGVRRKSGERDKQQIAAYPANLMFL